jgi:hypothetical protein
MNEVVGVQRSKGTSKEEERDDYRTVLMRQENGRRHK